MVGWLTRLCLGRNSPGYPDGWQYIGRGVVQITGRESYERYGIALEIDLARNLDLAIDPANALPTSAEEWQAANCNVAADDDSIIRVTKAINGADIGLASREEWLAKTKHLWI